MSLSAMVWAWQIPDLKTTEKIVLLCLADAANHENKCWPSQAHIAAKCSLKRQTVNKTLSSLAGKKLIGIEHRVSVRGQSSNIYFLAVSRGVTLNDTPVTESDTPCHPNGHPLSSTMTPPVIQDDTEPSIEPSNEPNDNSNELSIDHFFETEFWPAYPKKVGKGDALKALKAAAKRSSTGEIIVGLRRACDHWRAVGTDPQFIPNPGTWLRADRWKDEQPACGPPKRFEVVNGGGGTVFDKLRRKYEDEENDGRLF